jgi:hypothetical protein
MMRPQRGFPEGSAIVCGRSGKSDNNRVDSGCCVDYFVGLSPFGIASNVPVHDHEPWLSGFTALDYTKQVQHGSYQSFSRKTARGKVKPDYTWCSALAVPLGSTLLGGLVFWFVDVLLEADDA